MANPMVEMVAQTVADQTAKANALVEQINANTTDKGKLVHDIRNSPETNDPEVKAFQEWAEKAEAEINRRRALVDEHITKNLLPATADFDVDAAKAQYKELKSTIQAAHKFVETVPGYSADDFQVPELKNLRGGSSAGTGEGGKRPRLNRIWIDGQVIEKSRETDDGTVTVSNFTLAAAALSKRTGTKVQVRDLQAAAFAAAGTDDLSTLGGTVFDYYFEAGEGDKRINAHIEVEPKNTGETVESVDSDDNEENAVLQMPTEG